MRTMTKSVLQVACDALAAGEVALPTSASRFSPGMTTRGHSSLSYWCCGGS